MVVLVEEVVLCLTPLQEAVEGELGRAVPPCLASEGPVEEEEVDSCLGPVLSALVRQRSFAFLGLLEEQAVVAVKAAIKEVVVEVLQPTEEATLTAVVAEFAATSTAEAWVGLLDRLVGALVVVVGRVAAVRALVGEALEQGAEEGEEEVLERVAGTAGEVMVNICDQVVVVLLLLLL